MYKDFAEYWKEKQEIFEKLGVTEDVAYMIWCDAINTVIRETSKR